MSGLMLWIEAGVAVAIACLVAGATWFLFTKADMGGEALAVRLGALLHGAFLGLFVAFVILPLRLQFATPEAVEGAGLEGYAAFALLPVLILIRRGALNRVPGVRTLTRAYHRAQLKRQIRVAQEGLDRLDAQPNAGLAKI